MWLCIKWHRQTVSSWDAQTGLNGPCCFFIMFCVIRTKGVPKVYAFRRASALSQFYRFCPTALFYSSHAHPESHWWDVNEKMTASQCQACSIKKLRNYSTIQKFYSIEICGTKVTASVYMQRYLNDFIPFADLELFIPFDTICILLKQSEGKNWHYNINHPGRKVTQNDLTNALRWQVK